MRDVCFGEMLGCELQFYPAIGGKDWKTKFLHPLELNSQGR